MIIKYIKKFLKAIDNINEKKEEIRKHQLEIFKKQAEIDSKNHINAMILKNKQEESIKYKLLELKIQQEQIMLQNKCIK